MFFLGTAHLVTYLLIPAMLVIGLYFDVDADTQAETLLVDSPM